MRWWRIEVGRDPARGVASRVTRWAREGWVELCELVADWRARATGFVRRESRREPGAELRLAVVLVVGLLVWSSIRTWQRGGPAVVPMLQAEPLRIDPNRAPRGELLLLPGVGRVTAERIVRLRERRPFHSVEDLERVHGIGPVLAERMAPHLVFR